MAVLRINKKEKNFLILDKNCISNTKLSWGAKGLHTYLMGMRDDWQVKVSSLRNSATNGRDAVRGFLKELKEQGYITTAWVRKPNSDKAKGTYDYLEYVVHEFPLSEEESEDLTNNNSDLDPAPERPATGFQAPANPAPEKATLISINNNKDFNKQELKAAAAIKMESRESEIDFLKAAAALIEKEKRPSLQPKALIQKSSFKNVERAKPEDLVIAAKLTSFQQEQVSALVHKLQMEGYLTQEKGGIEEIQHCLLSQKHFTVSGTDFFKKLNSIRLVIQRGEWQAPAGLVIENINQKNQEHEAIKVEIQNAQSEFNHFCRLKKMATGPLQAQIEKHMQDAKKKLLFLEQRFANYLEQRDKR